MIYGTENHMNSLRLQELGCPTSVQHLVVQCLTFVCTVAALAYVVRFPYSVMIHLIMKNQVALEKGPFEKTDFKIPDWMSKL